MSFSWHKCRDFNKTEVFIKKMSILYQIYVLVPWTNATCSSTWTHRCIGNLCVLERYSSLLYSLLSSMRIKHRGYIFKSLHPWYDVQQYLNRFLECESRPTFFEIKIFKLKKCIKNAATSNIKTIKAMKPYLFFVE